MLSRRAISNQRLRTIPSRASGPRSLRQIGATHAWGAQGLEGLQAAGFSCCAMGPRVGEVFRGKYGPWVLEESDVIEVTSYRGSLTLAAICALLVAPAYLTDLVPHFDPLTEDVVLLTGGAAFGSATQLIHIYMSPIKKALQALWAFGFLSGAVLATQAFEAETPMGLLEYIRQNPVSIWFVGPLMASATGLSFKEGLCYGFNPPKYLVVLTPALCLTHLAGAVLPVPPVLEQALGGAWLATVLVFAASKWRQEVTDDLGDKSIFDFLAMGEEQQTERLRQLGMTEDM